MVEYVNALLIASAVDNVNTGQLFIQGNDVDAYPSKTALIVLVTN